MASDLISRTRLLDELGEVWGIPADWDGGIDETCETAFDVIENQPTVDAVEVVHGEWEECDWVKYDGHGECVHYPKKAVRCSNCCNAFKKELLYKDNYCPNCGAKMDVGER